MPEYIHMLLATLGGQPQVVTFTLDLLLLRGFPISEVVVIHPQTVQERLQRALACLNAEFVGDCYLLAFSKESQATLVTFDRGLLAFARKNGYAAVMPA